MAVNPDTLKPGDRFVLRFSSLGNDLELPEHLCPWEVVGVRAVHDGDYYVGVHGDWVSRATERDERKGTVVRAVVKPYGTNPIDTMWNRSWLEQYDNA